MEFYISGKVNSSYKKDYAWSRPIHVLGLIDIAVVAGNGNVYFATCKPYLGPNKKDLRHIVHDMVDFFKFHAGHMSNVRLVFNGGHRVYAVLELAFKEYASVTSSLPGMYVDLMARGYEFCVKNQPQVSTSILFKSFPLDGKVTWENVIPILHSADGFPELENENDTKEVALWMPKFDRFLTDISMALVLESIPDETETNEANSDS